MVMRKTRVNPIVLFTPVLAIALFSSSLYSAPLISETDILKPTAGYQGQRLGARIESVEKLDTQVKIKISLPKQLTQSQLEEVTVYGDPEKVVNKSEVLQAQRFEFIQDPNLDRNGLVIYLGKQQNFSLKLNYTEPRPTIEPDHINR